MVKINVNDTVMDEIKALIESDYKNSETGLSMVLKEANIQTKLKVDYIGLYQYLYDCKGDVDEDAVKDLIFADRKKMRELILRFGSFDSKKSNDLLDHVFRYDNFSKRKVAKQMLTKLNVRVCPYCNRQYTFTLLDQNVRPQFDHYYPKIGYPYLALSLYNLIPSCGICNQAKSKLDTYNTEIFYPYEDEFGKDIVFKIEPDIGTSYLQYLRGNTDKFKVTFECKSTCSAGYKAKQELMVKKLHLTELYDEHKDYVQDILKNHYINSPQRIKRLVKKYPQLFKSVDDVNHCIYMNDLRKENWGKRPLAKLTSDIHDEL